jgi:hypothetical protein
VHGNILEMSVKIKLQERQHIFLFYRRGEGGDLRGLQETFKRKTLERVRERERGD